MQLTQIPTMTPGLYFENVMCPEIRDITVRHIVRALSRRKFQLVAVSGYSAAMMGAIIAQAMGKRLVVVRKPTETSKTGHSHSHRIINGCLKEKDAAIFIDDLVSSGNTLNYVTKELQQDGIKMRGYVTYQSPNKSSFNGIKPLMTQKEQEAMFVAIRTKMYSMFNEKSLNK